VQSGYSVQKPDVLREESAESLDLATSIWNELVLALLGLAQTEVGRIQDLESVLKSTVRAFVGKCPALVN
jgi:hypothetical protein